MSSFSGYRTRICVNGQDDEERANAAYAEKHNLQALFSEMAEYLSAKNPTTESMAERALLEFLSKRTAESDRPAPQIQFANSFEVSLNNGEKFVKVQVGQGCSTLQLEQRGRIFNLDESFEISAEETEELVEMLYVLGRFVADGRKGEQAGFIRVDYSGVFFLPAVKECMEAGDAFFDLALHVCMRKQKKI